LTEQPRTWSVEHGGHCQGVQNTQHVVLYGDSDLKIHWIVESLLV
jgi:hypothetical protein